MPEKFTAWREEQVEGIARAIDASTRFTGQCAPTGCGKSGMGIAQALATGARTVYLTSTKGLQSQLMGDFEPSGLVDIRGMAAYRCNLEEPGQRRTINCAEGLCRSGYDCKLKGNGCDYYNAYRVAKNSRLVVTNYQYWMTIHSYGEGLTDKAMPPFDLMVCDEAHSILDELGLFLSTEIEEYDLAPLEGATLLQEGSTVDQWKAWGMYWQGQADERLQEILVEARRRREQSHLPHSHHSEAMALKKLLRKLTVVETMSGDWVVEHFGRHKVRFDPVWPGDQAERLLFRGVKRAVLYSAIITPKDSQLIGIPTDSYSHYEYPSRFPPRRRPVNLVPTVRVGMSMPDSNKRLWMRRIDQLLGPREKLGWNQIVHTVSYKLRDYILDHSNYSKRMIAHEAHDSRETVKAINRFKSNGGILISPCLDTGYNFPDDECRHQIIAKLPFPDKSSKVMQARMARDPQYYGHVTAGTITQITGRPVRSETDWGETSIVDDNIQWFRHASRDSFPQYWKDAVVQCSLNPKPMQIGR